MRQFLYPPKAVVALNTLVDIAAVFAAHRLMESGIARMVRAKLMNRLSGITMIFIGVFLAIAQRVN
ncbi:MAG: hypothetical protein Q7J51_01765 [Sheuella sp.]|nr:hypothetical protein [Sheuella sp.]